MEPASAEPRPNPITVLHALSLTGTVVVAVVCLLSMWLFLPETDDARGAFPLGDPFVFTVLLFVVVVVHPVAWLLAIALLRHTDLSRAFPRVLGASAATAATAAPFDVMVALAAALVAMVVAMLSCRKRYPLERGLDESPA